MDISGFFASFKSFAAMTSLWVLRPSKKKSTHLYALRCHTSQENTFYCVCKTLLWSLCLYEVISAQLKPFLNNVKYCLKLYGIYDTNQFLKKPFSRVVCRTAKIGTIWRKSFYQFYGPFEKVHCDNFQVLRETFRTSLSSLRFLWHMNFKTVNLPRNKDGGASLCRRQKGHFIFLAISGFFSWKNQCGIFQEKRQMMTLLFSDKLWYSWRVSWTVNIMNTQVSLRNMVRWCFVQLFSILTILPRFSCCELLWNSDFSK